MQAQQSSYLVALLRASGDLAAVWEARVDAA
jgi:hypothetical protein